MKRMRKNNKMKDNFNNYLEFLCDVRNHMSNKNRELENLITIGMRSTKRCSALLLIAFCITSVIKWFGKQPCSFLDAVTSMLGTSLVISIAITCTTLLFFSVCACVDYFRYVLCISFKEIPIFLLVYIAYVLSSKKNKKRIKRDMERYFTSTKQKRIALRQNSIEKHTIYVCQMLSLVSRITKEVF